MPLELPRTRAYTFPRCAAAVCGRALGPTTVGAFSPPQLSYKESPDQNNFVRASIDSIASSSTRPGAVSTLRGDYTQLCAMTLSGGAGQESEVF